METTQTPVISLDLKKQRIRIHKQTLHMLNDPCYVQFLVNPDQQTIAIKVCTRHARLAHKISYKASVDCDFYSKELLFQLHTVCPELVDGYTYRLPGVVYTDKGLAIFHMNRLTPVCEPVHEKNIS